MRRVAPARAGRRGARGRERVVGLGGGLGGKQGDGWGICVGNKGAWWEGGEVARSKCHAKA